MQINNEAIYFNTKRPLKSPSTKVIRRENITKKHKFIGNDTKMLLIIKRVKK